MECIIFISWYKPLQQRHPTWVLGYFDSWNSLILIKIKAQWRIYASAKRVTFGSENSLSPIRCHFIAWTNDDLLSIEHPWAKFSEIQIIYEFYTWKSIWKWHPQTWGYFYFRSQSVQVFMLNEFPECWSTYDNMYSEKYKYVGSDLCLGLS